MSEQQPDLEINLIEIDEEGDLNIWINDFHYVLDIEQYPIFARYQAIEAAAEEMAIRLEMESPNCAELAAYYKVLEAK